MNAELRRLAKRVNDAHLALNKAFEQEFPVGTRVRWLFRGKHPQTGTVEYNHPFGNIAPEMRVLNDHTNRLVWVGLSMEPCRTEDLL